MPPKKKQPERRSPFRIARDLYGETLGATSRQARQEVMEEWEGLSEGEQVFIAAQVGYLEIRALGAVHEKLTFIERWLERADQRAEAERRQRPRRPADEPEDDADDEAEDDEAEDDESDDDLLSDPDAPRATEPLPVKGRTGTAPKVLARPCPTCDAEPGEECRTRSGNQSPPHAARVSPPAATPPVEVLDVDGNPV